MNLRDGTFGRVVASHLLAASSFAASTPPFRAPLFPLSPAPQSPHGLATADFDLDGHADVVAACETSAGVVVLLGDGLGNLQPGSATPVGLGTTRLALGDLDGSAPQDVVVMNPAAWTFRPLLANGLGGFVAMPPITLPSSPTDLAIGEVTGDTNLDVILTLTGTPNVVIYRGDGAGGFMAHGSLTVPATAVGLTLADLDNDSDSDVVVASLAATVITPLFNDGTGSFSPTTPITTPAFPLDVEAADLDGDLVLDLVVCDYSKGRIHVYRGHGNATFTFSASYRFADTSSIPFTYFAAGIRLKDLSGDGRLDAIVLSDYGDTFVLRGNATAGFQQPVQAVTLQPIIRGIAVADMDEDGFADLVGSSLATSEISVALADGVGNFGVSNLAVPFLSDSEVGDFTGEGNFDLVMTAGSNQLAVWNGNGLGSFAPFSATTNPLFYSSDVHVLVGDVNGDSIADVAYTRGNNLDVRLGLGLAQFGPVLSSPAAGTTHSGKEAQFADLDLDGALDLVAYGTSSLGTASWFYQRGDGFGGFGAPTYVIFASTTQGSHVLEIADVDHNGFPDILASEKSKFTTRLTGPGASTLALLTTNTVNDLDALTIADFDLDSHLDVAIGTTVFSSLTSTLRVYRGDGAGMFTMFNSLVLPSGPTARYLASGDLDEDSDVDIGCAVGGTEILLLENAGNASFALDGRQLLIHSARGPQFVDLDQDGQLDMHSPAVGPLISLRLNSKPPCPGHVTNLLPGCAGSGGFVPHIAFVGCPTPGAVAKLVLSQGLGSTTGLMFFGASPTQLPIGGGCQLLGFPLAPIAIPIALGGIGPGNGTSVIAGQIPANSSPQSAVVQFFTLDPGVARGFAGSDAVFVQMQ